MVLVFQKFVFFFLIDERSQRISKRYANGLPKHEDVIDQTTSINGTHQKKNKTSHGQEKTISRQDSTTILKNEQTIIPNTISSNETDNKTRATILPTNNTATVNPIITPQPKKEKPTAK
jgi:hypothetical protein